MRTFFSVICAMLCLDAVQPQAVAGPASICSAVATNLVANCGFETGDFTSWTLSGNDVPLQLGSLYGVEGIDPLDGIAPNSGSDQAYFGDLDTNAITLSETLATTPGLLYQISWYLAQDTAIAPPFSDQFSASFGGTSLTSQTGLAVQPYTLYTFSATATKASTILSFTLGNDLGEFLLDDVVVSTTTTATTGSPEPGTWLLLVSASGLLAILAARSRRSEPVGFPRGIRSAMK
jgi:hypothetical protein